MFSDGVRTHHKHARRDRQTRRSRGWSCPMRSGTTSPTNSPYAKNWICSDMASLLRRLS